MTTTRSMELDGVHVRFYLHADARHAGQLLSDWLLQTARAMGIGGGSVFRAVAGYGRHGVLREETFFELAGQLPLKVEFIVSAAEADQMVQQVETAGVALVYARTPVRYGVIQTS